MEDDQCVIEIDAVVANDFGKVRTKNQQERADYND